MWNVRSLSLLLVAALALVSFGESPVLANSDLTDDNDMPKRTKLRSIVKGPASLGAGLRLLDGRKLYDGPRGMGSRYPYFVAANEKELAEEYGYALHHASAHKLLAPVESEAQALQLARWLVAGDIVPDRAAFDRMREIASNYELPSRCYNVTIDEFEPSQFGLEATRGPDGFEVRGTLFTSPGGAALCVIEYTIAFPPGEKVRIERKRAITGPPQSFQVAFHDPVGSTTPEKARKREEALERIEKCRAAIRDLKDSLLRALRKDLRAADIRKVYAQRGTWLDLKRKFGEPNRQDAMTGSELYFLGDGTVLAIPGGWDDAKLKTASWYASYDPEHGFGTKLGEIAPGL